MNAYWPRAAAALLLATAAMPTSADTLAAAIASAYENNPDILQQRAIVRQADEEVPQALAAGRPTLGLQGNANQSALDGNDTGRTFTGGIQATVPIYHGGRTRAATNAGDNRILAARARLRAEENTLIVNTVTAYADVIRYGRTVELNQNQVKVLERELQQSKDRFEVGDLTRTDVAQSDARLAISRSNVITARNQLAAARNAYNRLTGRLPENLEPLPPLPPLPGTEGQAVDLAQANNPSLIAAKFDEAAARYDVQVIEKQRLPSLDGTVGAQYQRFDRIVSNSASSIQGGGGGFSGAFFTQSAGITATVPLYQAGLVGSRTRAAQARRSQLMEVIGSTSRTVAETAANAFASLQNARAIIQATNVGVGANSLALEGVQQENQVGTRTVIEVLNAQQELLTVQVNLAAAQRDEQVAGYTLLAAAGSAEAQALGVPVTPYDAVSNAEQVRHKIGDGHAPDAPALPLPDKERASRSIVIGPVR